MIRLSRQSDAVRCPSPAGFTLVELMVVMVVLALLAALTLSALAGVRDRVKADKTRSTIRKLNDIILPQYESYLTRRVKIVGDPPDPPAFNPPTPSWLQRTAVVQSGTFRTGPAAIPLADGASSLGRAINRLWAQRLLMALELPDQWSDVATAGGPAIPLWTVTASVRRYAAYRTQVNPTPLYESSECLAMIVLRGGFDSDVIEAFRDDEMGDSDKDGAPEFLDGWGKPIAFIRWPTGFPASPLAGSPDPFDLSGVAIPSSPNVAPLIYSPGPDEALNGNTDTSESGYGLVSSRSAVPEGWVSALVSGSVGRASISISSGTLPAGSYIPPQDSTEPLGKKARDNITNVDFKK